MDRWSSRGGKRQRRERVRRKKIREEKKVDAGVQPFQKAQLQWPFNPSGVRAAIHVSWQPNLSYRFPIFEHCLVRYYGYDILHTPSLTELQFNLQSYLGGPTSNCSSSLQNECANGEAKVHWCSSSDFQQNCVVTGSQFGKACHRHVWAPHI